MSKKASNKSTSEKDEKTSTLFSFSRVTFLTLIGLTICLVFIGYSLLPKDFKFEILFSTLQNNQNSTSQPESNVVTTIDPAKQTQPVPISNNRTEYYSGVIDKNSIAMILKIEDSKVSGFYSYDHFNQPIKLTGVITKINEDTSNLVLDEFVNDKKNGTFELKYEKPDPRSNDISLTGKWTSLDNKTLDVITYTAFEENLYLSNAKLNDITFKPITTSVSDKQFSISYTYPEISGLKDTSIQNQINLELAKLKDRAEITKKDFQEVLKDDFEASTNPDFPGYSDEIDYHINYNQNNILSVEFSGYYYSGGAHGTPFVEMQNFDLSTGKKIGLADIFKPNTPYLNTLSSQSLQKLFKKYTELTPDSLFQTGLENSDDNFKHFTFTPKGGINITFDAYQVAAYAFGTPSITLSNDDLKDIIDSKYIFEPTIIN